MIVYDCIGTLISSTICNTVRLNHVLLLCRIFPLTVGNARTLDKDTVLSGYIVPKGVSNCMKIVLI